MRRSAAVATAVAFVAFVTLELVLGAAAAGTPENWSIAEPRVGDQGRYEVIELGPAPQIRVSDLRFERLAPRAAYYSDGTQFVADAMFESWTQSNGNFATTFWQTSLDDGTGGGAVHAKTMERHWSGYSSRFIGITIDNTNAPSDIIHAVTTRFDWDYGHCGLRTNLDADPPWFGGCPDDMTPLRMVDFDGDQVLVYGPASDPGKVQIWLHPDYPVPVQILRERVAATNETEASYDAYRLVGFRPGTGDPAPPTLGPSMPLGSLHPTVDGKPDPTGLEIAFPLAEALAEARGNPLDTREQFDPQGGQVAAFLDNPDVYVRAAALEHLIEQDYILRTWTIGLSDGQTEMTFTVTRDDPAAGNPAPFDPLETAGNGGRYDVDDVESFAQRGPTKAQLPPTLPSVGDAANAWLHAPPPGQEELTPNAYAFAHECANDDCTEVTSWVGAGPQTYVSQRSRYGYVAGVSPFPQDADFTIQASLRKLAGDGSLLRTDEIVQEGHRVSLGGLSTPPSATPRGPVDASSSTWTPPAGPITATAAGAAGLLGLLVYLLPALRHGPLAGLFSRIEAPRLTHHPMRAGIMAAVEAQPGIHFTGLMETLDAPHGALQHHIAKLLQGDLLTSTTDGHTTSYFVHGQTDHRVAATAPLLSRPGARKVLDALLAGGTSGPDIAAATGFSQSTVSHHVKRLRKAGLVDVERVGRTNQIRLTSLGVQASALAA